MTPERAKELLPVITAFANGDTIQFKASSDTWEDIYWESSFGNKDQYRIKPKPVTRPWSKPEDVPGPVCWIRNPKRGGCALIVRIGDEGIVNWCSVCGSPYAMTETSWAEFQTFGFEYSTDRKTWHPCTVTEEAP